MDHSKPHPVLPGSTPAPPPLGKKSVYQSASTPYFEPEYLHGLALETEKMKLTLTQTLRSSSNEGMNLQTQAQLTQSLQPLLSSSAQRKTQEKALQKMVAKLPYQVRESVSAIVNMSLSASETSQKSLEVSHMEVVELRSELVKKSLEMEQAQKNLEVYRSRLRMLEDSLEGVKEDLSTKTKFHLRNKHAMARLSSTNRMLIGSLNALQVEEPPAEQKSADKKGRSIMLKPMSYNDQLPTSAGHQDLTGTGMETQRPDSPNNNINPATGERLAPSKKSQALKADGASANERLRESLLRVARENYLSNKASEHLMHKIDELRITLRASEQDNRKLKNELMELKSVDSDEASKDAKTKLPGEGKQGVSTAKVRSFGKIDDRFRALLEREALDPAVGLMFVRRLLEHLAQTPISMRTQDVVTHICSREMIRIFDVEMICIFLARPGSKEKEVLKYTARSAEPEVISLSNSKSFVSELMFSAHAGHVARLNSLTRVANFNATIDGCPGVLAKRLLAIPLRNSTTNEIMGSLHMINKSQQGDAFSEADELLTMILSDQVSSLITQTNTHESVTKCSDLYRNILEASITMYRHLPDPDTLAAEKGLPLADVLTALEAVSKTALRCSQARAVLVSNFVHGFEPGNLLFLKHGKSARNRGGGGVDANISTLPAGSGVMGHVIMSKELHQQLEGEAAAQAESNVNPQIDIVVITETLVTVPIMNVMGEVFACLQLVPGPGSFAITKTLGQNPRDEDAPENRILFAQAAQWLAYQLITPVSFLSSLVNKPSRRPPFYPLEFVALQVATFDGDKALQIEDEGGEDEELDEEEGDRRRAAAISALRNTAGGGGGGGGGPSILVGMSKRGQTMSSAGQAMVEAVAGGEKEAATLALAAKEEELAKLKEQLDKTLAEAQETKERLSKEKNEAVAQAEADAKLKVEATAAAKEDLDKLLRAARDGEQREKEIAEHLRTELHTLRESGGTEGAKVNELANLIEALESQKLALAAEKDALLAQLESSQASLQSEKIQHLAATEGILQQQATLQQEKEEAVRLCSSKDAALAEKEAEAKKAQDQLTALQASLASQTAQTAMLMSSIQQKDTTILIMQEQLVKMAEDTISGLKFPPSITKEESAAPTPAPTPAAPEAIKEPTPEQLLLAMALESEEAASRPATTSPESAPEMEASSSSKKERPNIPRPASGMQKHAPATPAPASRQGRPSSRPGTGTGAEAAPVLGWTEVLDNLGQTYYFNTETGVTSWVLPEGATLVGGAAAVAPTDAAAADGEPYMVGDWQQSWDENGNEFFYNVVSGESLWELPEDAYNTQQESV